MKASRHAQWLVVPVLMLGLGLGPVAAARGLAPEARVRTAEPGGAKAPEGPGTDEGVEDEKGEPKEKRAKDAKGEPKEKETKDAKGEPKEKGAKDAKREPKERGAEDAKGEPKDEGAKDEGAKDAKGEPSVEDPADAEGSGDETDAADEGQPEESSGEVTVQSSESAGAQESGEVITVRPGPVTALDPEGKPVGRKSKPIGGVPSGEVTLDPRRRLSDQRIVFRASLLAFGVAGLALAPAVAGLNQRAYARRVLDQLDTPSEADARSEVERYERSMTTMAIIAGAASATSLVAGFVLLGVSLQRREAQRRVTLTPSAGSGTAGVLLRGRF